MTVTSPHPHHRPHHRLRAAALTFLTLIVIAGIAVCFAPKGWLHHLIGDKGSNALGRKFSVEGPIHFHWDWKTPSVELNQVRLANIQGAPEANMVDIDQVNFQIKIWDLLKGQLNLPVVTLVGPKIVLEKFDADTKNWDFPSLSKANAATHAALPSDRSSVPLIGQLKISQGVLTYRDKTEGLDTTLNIDTANGSSTESLALNGKGLLQGQTFNLNANGGSLQDLRNSAKDYPLNIDLKMGATEIKVNGVFHDIVKMEGVDTQVEVHGDNLADIFYLTGAPLPPSPPYSFKAHLQEEEKDQWTLNDIKGRMGESDIEGNFAYDTSQKRNYLKGEIDSKLLRMEDLAGFIGAKSRDQSPQNSKASDKLLPDVPINVTRLRAADLDVDFKASHINQPGYPMDNMNTHFHLKDGVLRIDPLSFGIADGTLSGYLELNGQGEMPVVETDLMLKNLSLKRFFDNTSFASLSSGHFGGRFKIKGAGKSLADVMANSNGRVALMMSGGSLSKLIADAAGLDIAHAAPELLDKDQKTDLRCAITDFGDKDGILNSDIFVVDTSASKIDGNTMINFKDETIDAKIEGHPKQATISGQIPITITGPLRHPSIGLGAKEAAARGGVAAALGAVLTPIAAIIPFINLDTAKDADCAALINTADTNSGVAPQSVVPEQP